jgi:hypothetical protein
MRVKVIELCITKGWRVTNQNTGEESKFAEITQFLSNKANAERVSVYDKEHTIRGPTLDHSNPAISHSSTPVGSMKPDSDPAIQETHRSSQCFDFVD